MYRTKLIILSTLCFCICANAKAQTCTPAPSCAELGFVNAIADCVGDDFIKCPFEQSNVFCRNTKSCESLGFDKTTTQCSGKKMFVCPTDATKVACDDSNMVGEIKLWPGNNIPKGWKICDGASLSTTTYSALYAEIGTTYGGSGSSFYLPNLSGRVPVGVGYIFGGSSYTYALAEKGGENFTTLSSDQIPDHKHITPFGEGHTEPGVWGRDSITQQAGSQGGMDWDNFWYLSSYMNGRSGYRSPPSSKTSSWGSSGSCDNRRKSSCSTTAHENRMPYLGIYYIIYTGVY